MNNGLHLTDTDYIQKISNHPVHIVDKLGNISPSAFIPFCQFGGNMSAMGQKYEKFDVPVCNSFKDKTLRGQVCYEVDPNKYMKSIDHTQKSEALRIAHLSPGISLISDLVHDSGMLQSELFTCRSQNLVLAKLPNSGFWRYGQFFK